MCGKKLAQTAIDVENVISITLTEIAGNFTKTPTLPSLDTEWTSSPPIPTKIAVTCINRDNGDSPKLHKEQNPPVVRPGDFCVLGM